MKTYEGHCGKCQRTRGLLEHKEQDPATKAFWNIVTCTKCGFNIDIKDVKDEPVHHTPPNSTKAKTVFSKHKGMSLRKYYGL